MLLETQTTLLQLLKEEIVISINSTYPGTHWKGMDSMHEENYTSGCLLG